MLQVRIHYELKGKTMDIASLLGLIGALGFIIYAMVSGGGVGPIIDVPSLAIVFGGTFFCVMYTCPLPTFLGSFGVMAKAFFPPVKPLDELVTKIINSYEENDRNKILIDDSSQE